MQIETITWHNKIDIMKPEKVTERYGDPHWERFKGSEKLTNAQWYNGGAVIMTYESILAHEKEHAAQNVRAANVGLSTFIDEFNNSKNHCYGNVKDATESKKWFEGQGKRGELGLAKGALDNEFWKQNTDDSGLLPGENGATEVEREYLRKLYNERLNRE